MRIVFVRHGQPDFDTRSWIGVDDVRRSLQRYKDARVTKMPMDEILILGCEGTPYFMTSGLTRAQDSAKLCQACEFEVSELLNEADLPHPKRLIIALPWSVLLFVCRIGWLLGYQSNAPGLRRDLESAKQAAELLVDRASEHVSVYVFGHGIMNRLIVRELTKNGWSVQSETGRGYWSRTAVSVADA